MVSIFNGLGKAKTPDMLHRAPGSRGSDSAS